MAVFCVAEKYQREQEIDKNGWIIWSRSKRRLCI